jgi:hypothetical protein
VLALETLEQVCGLSGRFLDIRRIVVASLFLCELVDPVDAMLTTPQERDRRQLRMVIRQLAVAPELELAVADGAPDRRIDREGVYLRLPYWARTRGRREVVVSRGRPPAAR